MFGVNSMLEILFFLKKQFWVHVIYQKERTESIERDFVIIRREKELVNKLWQEVPKKDALIHLGSMQKGRNIDDNVSNEIRAGCTNIVHLNFCVIKKFFPKINSKNKSTSYDVIQS